jgi:CUB domain
MHFVNCLQTWHECDEVQDYVTVYDGYTTRDPVLMRFCGGGQPVPPAVSSGPELLVEFTSSPYGTFLAPQSAGDQTTSNSYPSGGVPSALHGFQLDVQVTKKLQCKSRKI